MLFSDSFCTAASFNLLVAGKHIFNFSCVVKNTHLLEGFFFCNETKTR